MNEPVSFAVIGCGMLAQAQHLPNIVHSEKTRLHTCCDQCDDTLRRCRDRFAPQECRSDYREAISDADVQAICLATTERLRLPVIRAAAEAGKAVYTEKPLAAGIEEAKEIQEVVRASGIKFCVGHNRRCAPAMVEARRLFRDHMDNPQPCPWRWEREPQRRPRLADDGVAAMSVRINDDWYSWKQHAFDHDHDAHSPMLWEMTHFVDLCNWFLCADPESVVAQETGLLNHGVVIRYQTGEVATICMSGNGSFGYPKELYECMGQGAVVVNHHMVEVATAGIEGAPARVIFPLLNDPYPEVGTAGGLAGWREKRAVACDEAAAHGDGSKIHVAEPDKGHARMLDAFVDEIRDQRGPVCGVDDAVLATRVCLAAVRSAREQRFVRVADI